MDMKGNIFEITDIESFISSYIQNPNQPNPNTFRPLVDAKIVVGWNPTPTTFFAQMNRSTKTDTNGQFKIDNIANFGSLQMSFTAYRLINTIEVPFISHSEIPIYGPVYRSQSFSFNNITADPKRIYVAPIAVSNEMGISQDRINEEIKKVKNEVEELDSLGAFIQSGGIHVTGKGGGATIKFVIHLEPYTGSNLDSFIKHKIDNFDIDLPGPDFIVGLFVSKDKIKQSIKNVVADVTKELNSTIKKTTIQGVSENIHMSEDFVKNIFDTQMSMTFEKIRHPVIKEVPLWGNLKIKYRAIVPDPYVGIPRKLY